MSDADVCTVLLLITSSACSDSPSPANYCPSGHVRKVTDFSRGELDRDNNNNYNNYYGTT